MKTKVKAITSVMHGRTHMQPGDELEVTKGEADELEKAGLVEVMTEQQAVPQAETTRQEVPAEEVKEPTSERKMDDEPQNKMETAPENKADDSKPARKTSAKKAE